MILPLLLLVVVLLVALPAVGAAVTSVIGTLVGGLVIGALGRLVVPGRQSMGCLTTSLVGVAGSLLGALLARWLDVGRVLTIVLEVAVAAALVLLLAGRSRHRRPLTR